MGRIRAKVHQVNNLAFLLLTEANSQVSAPSPLLLLSVPPRHLLLLTHLVQYRLNHRQKVTTQQSVPPRLLTQALPLALTLARNRLVHHPTVTSHHCCKSYEQKTDGRLFKISLSIGTDQGRCLGIE